jgi:hypothetical protein
MIVTPYKRDIAGNENFAAESSVAMDNASTPKLNLVAQLNIAVRRP